MSGGWRLPPLRAIVDIQAELLAEHGGAAGLRDPGALEACLGRPMQMLAYADDIDLAAFATSLCAGICRIHHPFVDGNKRAGFAGLGMTLLLNDGYLDVAEREAARFVVQLAAGGLSEPDFAAWVRQNLTQS